VSAIGSSRAGSEEMSMKTESPFHEGEQRIQQSLGVRDMIEPWARQVVRPYLPEEHRSFHTSLPFLVAAARDGEGRPWATLLVGAPEFVRSPDPEQLTIETQPVPGDALEGALVAGTDLGLLGIELETRRRNRVNGRIESNGAGAIVFKVDQSFGNCPQYIHERSWQRVELSSARPPARRGARLTPAMAKWIAESDTLFISSGYRSRDESPVYGMDASHRGGDPGFVKVESDTRLVFPDYAGNNHYNTIGNLVMDPRAGMLFVDFERGSLLQLTGRTEIDWDSEALSRHPGAKRLVSFEIEEAVELREALPLRWSAATEFVRTLRLIEKIRESEDVTSFVFEARDGGPLPEFEAGQHLPLQLEMPGYAEPVRRTYSLSNGSGEDRYRISVKRETQGLASRFLHDVVEVGAFIDARRPAGEFVLSKPERPAVLISAGVGLTPMVSMLHELANGPGSQPVWFIHGARDGAHHPLAEEVRDLVAGRDNVHAHVAYSRARQEDLPGVDFDSRGRVDAELIADLVPDLNASFYLCGPARFMADVQSGLIERGVHPDHIHAETFGPVGCASCG
jgi:ferredoxin-NADP reductase/predicted pyridoxine 5'-phosphate oxidase superfamily flavin-nucleotide-binding protein